MRDTYGATVALRCRQYLRQVREEHEGKCEVCNVRSLMHGLPFSDNDLTKLIGKEVIHDFFFFWLSQDFTLFYVIDNRGKDNVLKRFLTSRGKQAIGRMACVSLSAHVFSQRPHVLTAKELGSVMLPSSLLHRCMELQH
jgi:hypothetical protein